MTCGSRAGSDPICCHGSREDLRSVWPAPRLAGITGYRPASCGDSRPIPVRDLRGMEISRRRLRPVGQQKLPICRDFGGSDGTRTRDLRRDRPVLVFAGWAGIGGDCRREQGFPTVALRGSAGVGGDLRDARAGSARDVLLPHRATHGGNRGGTLLPEERGRALEHRVERVETCGSWKAGTGSIPPGP
jgi:hypothetical protein